MCYVRVCVCVSGDKLSPAGSILEGDRKYLPHAAVRLMSTTPAARRNVGAPAANKNKRRRPRNAKFIGRRRRFRRGVGGVERRAAARVAAAFRGRAVPKFATVGR